jgi:hypothetical protein
VGGAVVGLSAFAAVFLGGGWLALERGKGEGPVPGSEVSATALAAATPFRIQALYVAQNHFLDNRRLLDDTRVEQSAAALQLAGASSTAISILRAYQRNAHAADLAEQTRDFRTAAELRFQMGELAQASRDLKQGGLGPTTRDALVHLLAGDGAAAASAARAYALSVVYRPDMKPWQLGALTCIADAIDAARGDTQAVERLQPRASVNAVCQIAYAGAAPRADRLAILGKPSLGGFGVWVHLASEPDVLSASLRHAAVLLLEEAGHSPPLGYGPWERWQTLPPRPFTILFISHHLLPVERAALESGRAPDEWLEEQARDAAVFEALLGDEPEAERWIRGLGAGARCAVEPFVVALSLDPDRVRDTFARCEAPYGTGAIAGLVERGDAEAFHAAAQDFGDVDGTRRVSDAVAARRSDALVDALGGNTPKKQKPSLGRSTVAFAGRHLGWAGDRLRQWLRYHYPKPPADRGLYSVLEIAAARRQAAKALGDAELEAEQAAIVRRFRAPLYDRAIAVPLFLLELLVEYEHGFETEP